MTSIFSSVRLGLANSARDLVRNIWLSGVALTTMVLAFFSLHALLVLQGVSVSGLDVLASRVDLSVAFSNRVSSGLVEEIMGRIRELPHVESVTRLDRESRLVELKERVRDTRGFETTLSALGENPLGDLVVVKVDDVSSYEAVGKMLEELPGLGEVATLHYRSMKNILMRLEKIVLALKRGTEATVALFGLIALLVVVNMIRMIFYIHRDEIAVMRLVGASDGMIRVPFFFAITIVMTAAFVISLILTVFAWKILGPSLIRLLGPELIAAFSVLTIDIPRLLTLEFLGALILVLGVSALTMRRYLRV